MQYLKKEKIYLTTIVVLGIYGIVMTGMAIAKSHQKCNKCEAFEAALNRVYEDEPLYFLERLQESDEYKELEKVLSND